MYFSFFYLDMIIFLFQLITCAGPTPWFISQPPDWIWRHHGCCSAANNNNKQGEWVCGEEKILTIFALVLWYDISQSNSFPPTLPWFICQAPDWIWRHHLHPPYMNRSKKQCLQRKGETVFPSHFLHCCSYFYINSSPPPHQQWYSSPQTESKTISSSSPHQQQ